VGATKEATIPGTTDFWRLNLESLALILILALAAVILTLAIRDSRRSDRNPNYYLTPRALVVTPAAYLLGMLAIIFLQSLIWPHQPSSAELTVEVVAVIGLTAGLRLWKSRPRD
jgi:hypothetical protein